MNNKDMPVMNAPSGCAKFVPIEELNESHSLIVHGQTLDQLALRGGLTPLEIYMNVHRIRRPKEVPAGEFLVEFVNGLAEAALAELEKRT